MPIRNTLPKSAEITLPDEQIIRRIYVLRGKKVMLDRDLAKLYGVWGLGSNGIENRLKGLCHTKYLRLKRASNKRV